MKKNGEDALCSSNLPSDNNVPPPHECQLKKKRGGREDTFLMHNSTTAP